MNYKESALTGKKWKRASRVTIENPVGDGKAITFHEEVATLLTDGTLSNYPDGAVREAFTDPTQRFQLRSPADDSVVEGASMSYQEIYVALHSLYLHLAAKRDAKEAEAVAPAG